RQALDVVFGHSRSDGPPRDVHALRPLIVQYLRTVGDDQIHRDVFGPCHVPQEPDQRVEVRGRTHAHVVIAQSAEDSFAVRGTSANRVEASVLDEKELGGFHGPASAHTSKTDASRLSALRTPWRRPHVVSRSRVSGEARSRPGSSNRWFVGKMTRNVKGTTRKMQIDPTSQSEPPVSSQRAMPAMVAMTASGACIIVARL